MSEEGVTVTNEITQRSNEPEHIDIQVNVDVEDAVVNEADNENTNLLKDNKQEEKKDEENDSSENEEHMNEEEIRANKAMNKAICISVPIAAIVMSLCIMGLVLTTYFIQKKE